jgi:erythromycin esterase
MSEQYLKGEGEEEQQTGRHYHKLEKPSDLDALFEHITSNVKYVLLGEASHGTSEFYNWRIEITKRLIAEKKFSFIAVEGDWPACYNVNRYVKGISATTGSEEADKSSSNDSAYDVLYSFNRWPTWMWANREIVELVEWLRKHNEQLPDEEKVGFYGLDVYSLWESMEAVIKYLKKVDSTAIKTAIEAYQCFEPYGRSVEDYARAMIAFVPESCEDEVIDMLIDLHSKAAQYKTDGIGHREAYFNAEQNAIVAKNAELYYRKMIQGGTATWNIRDTHMMETLKRLMEFHNNNNNNNNKKDDSKSIVWAHNTHIGDARQTDMADAKMINLGQLVREYAGDKNAVLLVGFGTYKGSVIAAKEWGETMEKMTVPPAIEGSWDSIIHKQSNGRNTLLVFRGESNKRNKELLATTITTKKEEEEDEEIKSKRTRRKGQRAIGVVYNSQYEKYGNYVPTILDKRYDAFLFVDKTHALHPLHMPEVKEDKEKELPETFPTGL